VRHGHGPNGGEEFHVRPTREHGHLHCSDCGATWELDASQASAIEDAFLAADGFEIDIGHVTLVGRCRTCASLSPR
jgi:Fur family ferric uptake transcriptional regulator